MQLRPRAGNINPGSMTTGLRNGAIPRSLVRESPASGCSMIVYLSSPSPFVKYDRRGCCMGAVRASRTYLCTRVQYVCACVCLSLTQRDAHTLSTHPAAPPAVSLSLSRPQTRRSGSGTGSRSRAHAKRILEKNSRARAHRGNTGTHCHPRLLLATHRLREDRCM